jgi:TPR repeat protein
LWWVLDEIKGVAGGEQQAVVVDVQIRKEGTTLFPCLSPNGRSLSPLSSLPRTPAGPEAGLAAVQLYKRAAAQGNHEALLRVGDSYWYGKGVPRDWSRAAQVGVFCGA